MKFGVFATGKVGSAVLDVFARAGQAIDLLAVDSRAGAEARGRLADAARVTADRVIGSDDIAASVDRLAELDLVILAWWPYLLKPPTIRAPRLGCLNLHPSLLPYNRGKHYNFWTIVERTPFGVTIHFVDDGVDSGDIAFQRAITKGWQDTGQSLYQRAQDEIVRLFADSFAEIRAGRIPRTPQDPAAGGCHRAAELEPASCIDLERTYPARDLLDLLRARTFPPHPGAWFVDGGVKYQVRISIQRVEEP